jgi:hypothetical protein
VIPPEEAAKWVRRLLVLNPGHSAGAATALVLLARRTGDRARDLPEEVREQVAHWLQQMRDPERFLEILTDPHSTLSQEEESWVFGESLPTGLVLFQENEVG